MHYASASQAGGGSAVAVVIFIIIGVAAYWTPTIVAWTRHVPNAGSVTVINGLLGWTLAGWAIALAMACRSHHPQQIAVIPYGPGQPGGMYQPVPPQPPPGS